MISTYLQQECAAQTHEIVKTSCLQVKKAFLNICYHLDTSPSLKYLR